MTHSRWQQIEGLFYTARQRTPGERAAFLAEVCAGDDELCRAVYSLFERDTSTPGPLEPVRLGRTHRAIRRGLYAIRAHTGNATRRVSD
jgi:hypothetical protein